jgi:hypothetical protein
VSVCAHAQVNVTTYHNDNSRTGQNTQETILTPSNVNSFQFGKLFSVSVDGAVYAQPLYLWAVKIAGATHNVLYVVTEHDSVYAIDADTGKIYQHVSLIASGGTTVNSSSDLGCGDLVPEVGITGTPVIDSVSGTLYVVAKSKVGGSIVQYLHALDVATLAEKFNGPMNIHASVPGSGYDSSGGMVTFNPKSHHQRAALLLENGHVVIGWGSHCDNDPWHGWVMSYNATSLAQEGVFNTSPNRERAGVWMSGGGAAADANGNIYFPTGNGCLTVGSCPNGNGTTNYGDSILKLGPPANGSFPVLDYFTPYNQQALDTNDNDVASGGLVLLPPLASGQQLLAQQGKQGTIYLLNTSNMGKYCLNLTPPCTDSDPQIAQEIPGGSGIWGSPAYWNGNLYWTGANDHIKARSFNANNSGLISTSPTSESAQIFAFSAPTPTISANGNSNGILWALDGSADDSTCGGGGSNCLGLYAYDATNLAHLLYDSTQAANNRDSPGTAVKFEKPIVANGKVYVGTQSSVTAYGLLGNVAPSPVFSPAPGSYTSAQSIALSDAIPGAAIYYTTNGTTPSVNSALYTAPLHVSSTETIQAIAVASGYSSSVPTRGTYFLTFPSPVNLAAVDNVHGIANNGSAPADGGLDQHGNAYSTSLLGTSISWAGATFNLGAAGTSDAVSEVSVALPTGHYSTLALLGAGVNGNQPNQTFIVTYSDGTTTSFTQSVSDWRTPQNYAGEAQVSKMAYAVAPSGALLNGAFYVYGYSFALNSAKTVASITLPKNPNVVILAIDVSNIAVNDPTGFSSSAGLTLNGTTLSNGTLELTNGATDKARSVWTARPLNVQNFTTDFNFQITPAGAHTADGFAFTVQNAGPNAQGSSGGGLGYAGIGTSVAVKFDLYSNAGEGPDSTGFYTDGAYPSIPALNLAPSGVNLHSGDVMHAHITYDGTTLTLTLIDTVTGASFTASQAIDIPTTVGGNLAYVGFTAGTGGLSAVQQILSWTYLSGQTAVVNDAAGFASAAGMTFEGVTLTGGTLELTNGAGYEDNSVWEATPVNVQNFTTDFSFQETAASADGFTFAIQNAAANALGKYGGGLGYAGIASSVAVKFDLYSNSGEGPDSTGFYVDGAYPSVPALNLTPSGVNLHGTDILRAHINYDGTTLTLTLTDTVTGASFTASQAINIPATVGGNSAYVGFTAGTGGLSAVQQILNWTYVVN